MPDRRAFLRDSAAVAAAVLCGVPAVARPRTFDPRAFCNDLIAAGCRVSVCWPMWTARADEDLQPYLVVRAPQGRGLGRAYSDVMARWSDAIDACPDHVGCVIAYAENFRT